MSQTAYTPGPGGIPFGNQNTNPQSSQYAAISGQSPTESILIQKAVKEAIFDAAPDQYNALKLVFEKSMKEYPNDEFEYLESTFGRSAVIATGAVGAVAAVPGTNVNQTIPATTTTAVTPNVILVYPDNTKAIVKTVNAGVSIVVQSQTSAGLPAVANGDVFAIQSTIDADGTDSFANYERLDTITRYNFIQLFLRASRWGRLELLKHQNSGTTNYIVRDKQEKIRQMRTDLFNSFFNGTRGEFLLSGNNIPAKSMGGIFPTMVAAGSMNANPTIAGLRASFETLAFNTNFKKEGATRMIYGTQEMLYEISKIFKDPGLRYSPNDRVANLDLDEYKLGNMRFVPVACELFREQSCFPRDWARRILVVDQETVNPVKMTGLPAMYTGETLDRGSRGTREMFKDWYIEANLSLEFNNPLGSFWIDVQ